MIIPITYLEVGENEFARIDYRQKTNKDTNIGTMKLNKTL